ncbi:MAG: alpha/beta hydrolase [Burkholderiales bacterium]|nr:alpha/beta hydrolase [Burkholderiales bacterium]
MPPNPPCPHRRVTLSRIISALALGLASPAWAQTAPYQIQFFHIAEGVDVDVFIPSNSSVNTARPALLMIPGGGWSTSDKQAMHPLCDAFARQGFVAVATTYRHAPQNAWPAQLIDVTQVVWQMREHAQALGIDPQRIGAIGASAGALLAGHLGSRDERSPRSGVSSQVQRVISIGGPWNLAHVLTTFQQYNWQTNPVYPDVSALGMISNLFGHLPTEQEAAQASPYYWVSPHSAPTLMLHGTADTLVPPLQSTETCKHIRDAGARCDGQLFNGVGHTITADFLPPMLNFLSDWAPASR